MNLKLKRALAVITYIRLCSGSSIIKNSHISDELYNLAKIVSDNNKIVLPDKNESLDIWNMWFQKNFLKSENIDDQDTLSISNYEYHNQIEHLIHKLGLINEKLPKHINYDCVVIFGGTPWDTLERFMFIKKTNVSSNNYVYINGLRKLNNMEIDYIKQNYNETIIYQHEFADFLWNKLFNDDLNILTIEPYSSKRINTFDTIKVFFDGWNNYCSYLFVSNNPYGLYQKETLMKYVNKNVRNKIIDICYSSINRNIPTLVYLDTIARRFYTKISN